MSRLIVKGLPKNINEEKLRNVFKEFGSITDVSLKFTKEGVFRKFAFIGFDSEENAQKALKKTNNSFIQTSKIIVEECKSFGDDTKPRPWSKYSKGSSAYKRKHTEDQEINEDKNNLIKQKKLHSKKAKKTETSDEEFVDMNKEKEKVTEMIMDTGRLFVRNLPYICSEDDLMFMFKKYGEISDVQFVIDKKTGKSKGFAIVTFLFPENALSAYTLLDGTIFKGRMLHILPGNEKPEPKEHLIENQPGVSQFQKAKLAKMKSNSGKAHSWNALFLGANAIADTLAEKLQVEKSDFLAGDVDNSAGVRMALAETRIVRETRDFLISHGVKLDAFSRPAANRSDTIMILKNLPSHVQEDELRRMFERFGVIKKLILPPEGGVSALLEMENKVDAKKAFSALAYSRLRTQPLYLEWAPIDVFDSKKLKETTSSTSTLEVDKTDTDDREKQDRELSEKEKKALRKSKRHRIEEKQLEEEFVETDRKEFDHKDNYADENDMVENQKEDVEGSEEKIEPGATVFVKNLNFETTDEELHEKFSQLYKIESALVSKKADPSNPNKMLSMGFGFIQFYKEKDAKDAIKNMQGILLDGHSIELKLSNREMAEKDRFQKKSVSKLEQGNCTKLLVRNIPFQASKKEINQLFSTFGDLRNLRLPKKVGSDQHRGFGFVEYGSKGEAKRAFDALVHSTHLYSRRLVLEWAKTEETVEELRTKTSQKFSGTYKESKHSKRKMMKALDEGTPVEEE